MPEYELSKENAHPLAAELLHEEFWWDCVDETTPFGNDTGADILAEYWKWRRFHEAMSSIAFLPKIMQGWEVDDSHRDLVDEKSVLEALQKDEFSVTTYDDSVIALYFAELVVNGRRDQNVRPLASMAIDRQMLSVCLGLYADDVQDERLAHLVRMKELLLSLK